MVNNNMRITGKQMVEAPAELPETPVSPKHARRGPLRQARLTLAISAGKLAAISGRVLGIGGGTSLPGMVARRIDPDVLKAVMSGSAAKKIVITGSNGKTTTSRMIAEMAKESGNRLSHNRSGSNLLQGVTSVAVNFANPLGQLESDVLVFEIDEGTMQHVVPEIQPDVVVITNIFRDQLDRFGELYAVARSLDRVLEDLPETSTIVLNGNDPQVANFGQKARARRLFFGLNTTEVGVPVPDQSADVIRCIHCQEDLEYKVAYLSHLGLYRCPHCGYTLPPLDIAATSVRLASDGKGPTHATLSTPEGELEIEIPLPGVHNVYNAAAAVGAALAAGFPKQKLAPALAKLQPAFGRLEEIRAGDQTIYLSFVKNPTSFNLIMRLIMQHPGQKHLLLAASHTVVDGEDFSWLWDLDLEELAPDIMDAICSGNKPEELAMRLKYAEVPTERIRLIEDREQALDAALKNAGPGGTLYILATYSPTQELRRIMQKRGWVKHFWEE
ncbi:MAG TPA: MurT ligase domain-containing protein [Ktedonobacteraceae bacterium]|nr:MurT ligase domain-containing protein [Ktedonobacteraceae bacterium]